ncbi:MAG: energy transducer TonB [Acidobacteriota bacterium]
MSNKQLRFISFGCLIALSANSVTLFAQGAVTVQPKQELKRVWVATPDTDGKSETHTYNFVMADGQQATLTPTEGTFEVVTAGPGGSLGFINGEMSFDSQVVKGVPFSAVAVNETTQTLSDGNRIVRRSSTSIYRDGEGRTRREQALATLGPWTGADNTAQRIFINDPVNGTSYVLDPRAQTAQKNSMPAIRMMSPGIMVATASSSGSAGGGAGGGSVAVSGTNLRVSGGTLQGQALKRVQPEYPPIAKAAGAEGSVTVQITVNEAGQVTSTEAVSGHPLLRQAALDAAKQWVFKPTELSGKAVKVQGNLAFNFVLDKGANTAPPERSVNTAQSTFSFERVPFAGGERVEFKRESLGKQTIEGIEAEGTRTINTIPAGSIGNERPIEIVSERWYSAALQAVVLTRHSDPRTGESVYRLENINRSEPAASLFLLPTDYTVNEPARMLRRKVEQQ